jgi:putative spermidine/putrescine transport system substrate-binding protein
MHNLRRRKFLGMATASLATGLTTAGGCSLFAEPNRLRVSGLASAIPGKLASEFEKGASKSTELKIFKNYAELWNAVKEIKSSDRKDDPDLIGMADGWLDRAIAANLIQSFSPEQISQQIPQWQQLAEVFKTSVTRNQRVWGIPFRWGTTAIAYRSDKVTSPIAKWQDLWRQELQGKITLPDNQREVIGIVLKKLGHSYQTTDLNSISELRSELKSLHRQVKIYTNQHYLQTLVTGDSWVAVGWTIDLIKVQQLYPDLQIIIPQEGSALWTDIWTVTQETKNLTSAVAWQNFFLQPAIAAKISALTDVASTIPALDLLPQSVKENAVKFPSAAILAKCEPLLPLPSSTVNQYQKLWQDLATNT